jgi:hypothetical protein
MDTSCSMRTEGLTDMQLTVAFRNSANAPDELNQKASQLTDC